MCGGSGRFLSILSVNLATLFGRFFVAETLEESLEFESLWRHDYIDQEVRWEWNFLRITLKPSMKICLLLINIIKLFFAVSQHIWIRFHINCRLVLFCLSVYGSIHWHKRLSPTIAQQQCRLIMSQICLKESRMQIMWCTLIICTDLFLLQIRIHYFWRRFRIVVWAEILFKCLARLNRD